MNKTRRIALITGGVGGIGTAICKRIARDGHFVIANYAIPGTEEKWNRAMAAVGLNGSASALAFGDVTQFDAMGDMVRKIEREHGPIDILVNCAGITRDATFKKMTLEQWRAVLATNLDSVFNVTRHVIDGMTERGWGRIVNISSVNALKGQFGQTNYSAAKAGMHGFSKALAQEVVKKGVTVNTVSPGYVETDMVRAMKPEILQSIVEQIPMGRLAQPEEIAGLVAYLASEEAGYITGANISINGGLHMV
ncbi:MAG: acetoacetyl-CoA reductase [Betaproteobacteria bacterium]|nr:MAG: acetoacetyl-CoA reductase [Betaproteobacteria bacterium]